MAAEASVNAMYAKKIAEIERSGGPRRLPRRPPGRAARPTSTCCRLASELVVDAVTEPGELRGELVARLADADGWTRAPQRRHHHISPV